METSSTGRLTILTIEDAPGSTSTRIRQLLYTSHFLSTWNSRLFEFGAFLFLASLYPSTLLPASVYALARAAAGALLSPWVGSFIDSHDRLMVVRLSISCQRLPVILSCVVFAILLMLQNVDASSAAFGIALAGLSVLASVEKLAIVMNTIAIERDWVVVIAGSDETGLNELNSRMRRIDLFCKLLAPLAVSCLDAYSTKIAIMITALLSAVSWAVEYFAIARVYHALPELQLASSSDRDNRARQQCAKSFVAGMASYIGSPAVLPSLSLSLLYLTALSFNGQLITYLLAPPILLPAVALGVLRGIAACAELSATFLGPMLITRIEPLRAGSWFLNGQLIFVTIAASTLWLPTSVPLIFHLPTFITSIVLSRIGLWGFDLAAQQQIQDAVPESSRGTFSSVEAALQNAFEMISFASTIIWADPAEFKIPGAISTGAVLAAAVLYTCFVRQRRGHLLHFDRAVCGSGYWKSHFGKTWTRLAEDDFAEDGSVEDDFAAR